MRRKHQSLRSLPNGTDIKGTSEFASSVARRPRNSSALAEPQPSQPYKFVELFCGGGGARLGFGPHWRCVYANDISTEKGQIYRANFGSEELRLKDVREVLPDELPNSDLLWASFPCQDHSSAGNRLGLKGTRATLVFDVVDLLTSTISLGTAPTVVVLENVLGLLHVNEGRDFEAVLMSLVSAGYRVGCAEIDATHFVPQSRKRLFIVASRVGGALPKALVSKTPLEHAHSKALVKRVRRLPRAILRNWVWWNTPKPPERLYDLQDIVDAPWDIERRWLPPEKVSSLLATMEKPSRDRLDYAKGHEAPFYGTGVFARAQSEGSIGRAFKLIIDGATCCVMAKADLHYGVLVKVDFDDVSVRKFTRPEYARLMGFPKTYILPASRSATARLMGEGVVVPVVRFLAANLLEPLVSAMSPRPSTIAEVPSPTESPARNRKCPVEGVKKTRVKDYPATTAYFLSDELDRVHCLADSLGISLHEMIMRGLDALLSELGRPPLIRICRPEVSGSKPKMRRTRFRKARSSYDTVARIKDLPGTTAYFLPDQLERVHMLARHHGVSAHEILMRAVDRVFHAFGSAPVRRATIEGKARHKSLTFEAEMSLRAAA